MGRSNPLLFFWLLFLFLTSTIIEVINAGSKKRNNLNPLCIHISLCVTKPIVSATKSNIKMGRNIRNDFIFLHGKFNYMFQLLL